MLHLLLNPRVLFLLCLLIVLTGCQHPLAPGVAGRQLAVANRASLDAQATERIQIAMQMPAPTVKAVACVSDARAPESREPKAEPPVAAAQKAPDGLTGQLADGFMLVFETFTGRSHPDTP